MSEFLLDSSSEHLTVIIAVACRGGADGATAPGIQSGGIQRSGVQRLLDARGQRGSQMPSKIFCIPLVKFLTTFFSRSPKFFTFFASVVKFHENSLLRCPTTSSSPSDDIFKLLFWSFTYIF